MRDEYIRVMDDLGRIVIPREMRIEVFNSKCYGDKFKITTENDKIILERIGLKEDERNDW